MDKFEGLAYLIPGHLPIPLTPEIYPLSALEDREKSVRSVWSSFPKVYDLGYVEPMTKIHENRRVDFCVLREAGVFFRKIISASLFVAVSVSLAAARDLAVVSNKANSLAAISLPDLVKACKAQINRWPDGKPVTLLMRAPSTPEMKLFLEKVYELPEAQVKDLIATAGQDRVARLDLLVRHHFLEDGFARGSAFQYSLHT